MSDVPLELVHLRSVFIHDGAFDTWCGLRVLKTWIDGVHYTHEVEKVTCLHCKAVRVDIAFGRGGSLTGSRTRLMKP